jgi:hypothetical protein
MFLIPLQTDNKQILRRWAPQNDIATSPQGDGRQAHPPNFREGGEHEGHEGFRRVAPRTNSGFVSRQRARAQNGTGAAYCAPTSEG